MADFDDRIRSLRDDAWEVARMALDSQRTHAYRSLTSIVEQLSTLAGTTIGEQGSADAPDTGESSDLNLPVFARYKGTTHAAVLNRGRVNGGRGACIWFRDDWLTASAAATAITNTSVNGWRFWSYRRPDGSTAIIDGLR